MTTPLDKYLALTPRERVELLDYASRESGLPPSILEKDYWVCKTLDVLFSLPELGEQLVFKGGTSLSKVYGLIERFSEDVDVSFHREFLGFGDEHDPEAATGKEQSRRIEALQQACKDCIRERLLPALHTEMAARLGGEEGWSMEIDAQDAQTILFHFPQAGAPSLAYIAPSVRIELGARSDHWPQERHEIKSYLSEALDRPIGGATVQSLAAERTFWEKATILHAEAHRDPAKPMPARFARHYHDLACMAEAPVAEGALADKALRERVVAHKSAYFRSGWARYDLAVPETFRLLPPESRLTELEADHQAMLPMFFRVVGDRDPRSHEYTLQVRAFDAGKSGAATGVGVLLALCSALLEKNLKGGLAIVGGLNLGGSIEPVYNAVSVVEAAADKGCKTILMPVSTRKLLFDLPDEVATRVAIIFYSDARDALLKALNE